MKLHKFRGQHILKNRKIAFKMLRHSEVESSDTVVEVGCGTGVLTELLLSRGAKVVGIEIDRRFVEILKNRFRREIENSQFELLCGDALKVDFPEFDKFVSNIPYSISSPLTFKLIEHEFDRAVVMYQKEFAERLVATRGKKYGRLSVMVRAYVSPKIVEIVDRTNFYPVPRVDSAIVVMEPYPEIDADVSALEKVVSACFRFRRKKLARILKQLGFPESTVRKYGDKRAEELTPQEYAELANRLSDSA